MSASATYPLSGTAGFRDASVLVTGGLGFIGSRLAACLADVFSLEDALTLVARRAALVQAQPAGAMLAVRLPEDDLAPMLGGQLSIAAINSDSSEAIEVGHFLKPLR